MAIRTKREEGVKGISKGRQHLDFQGKGEGVKGSWWMEFISRNGESAGSMGLGRVSGVYEITLKTTGEPRSVYGERKERREGVCAHV